MSQIPRPSQAPDDYTDAMITIKLSPDWFAMMQGIMQSLEPRANFEEMSDAEYEELLDWFGVLYLLGTDEIEATVEIGTIIQSALSTAPAGYLACDGSAVDRTTYAALFTAIGTKFGAGNGTTTFNLPDLRQKFVKGANVSSELGNVGGLSTVTLTEAQIPAHKHFIRGVTGSSNFTNAINGNRFRDQSANIFSQDNLTPSSSFQMQTDTISQTGGGGPHENEPPHVKLMYFIKY